MANNSIKPIKLKISRYTSAVLFRLFDLDLMLEKAKSRGAKRFVTAWLRGLGDTSIILSESVKYIIKEIPGAEITLLLRPGIEEAAKWIEGVKEIITISEWNRDQTINSLWGLAFPTPWEIKRTVSKINLKEKFDMILPYPLGKWWFKDTAQLRPSLKWTPKEEKFGRSFIEHVFPENRKFVITINSFTGTEVYFQYNRDWGFSNFKALISAILNSIPEARVILVDKDHTGEYPTSERVFDARGKLSISESISIIANSDLFICLDTGPANLVYFLEGVSLNMIALLGELHSFFKYGNLPASRKVILKKVVGRDNLVKNIPIEAVMAEIFRFYRRHKNSPMRPNQTTQ